MKTRTAIKTRLEKKLQFPKLVRMKVYNLDGRPDAIKVYFFQQKKKCWKIQYLKSKTYSVKEKFLKSSDSNCDSNWGYNDCWEYDLE